MNGHDWTKFTLTADFDTDMRSIYKAWTTAEGLESWFLRKANFYTITGRMRNPQEFILKEDIYEWYWHGFDDGIVQKGEIMEVNSTDFLKFSFTDNTIVSVSLSMSNGLTILELTQENIKDHPDPSRNLFVQCQTGWTFYLANLKSIVEGGIDLRNKRADVRTNFK
ncbi:MAG: SRPBCC family protein [Mucilaginibacter sp.]|jgi:uncharacterized protein YndB with AHSA1/START domain